ncbi:MAG: starch-binding protein, partial [Eubacteriales bacterium]|nr:starch-binding protein [Eubacteriales bacterium]
KPTETEPATSPTEPGAYLYGDADLDGKVTVKDATLIQKCAAKMLEIEGKAFTQANVNGDSALNVRDATAIQKKVANLLDKFPVEEKTVVSVGAGASDLTSLIATVKSALSAEYKYASYDAYMALKKQYYAYKDKAVSSMSASEITAAYTAINKALTDYNTMKKNNGGSSTPSTPTGGEITVYFTNNNNWSNVYAYIWKNGGSTLNSWPGTAMTYVKTNSQNQKVYSITLDSSKYDMIIFNNNGSSQTVDISLTGEDGIGYYISGGSGKSLTCSTYTFA